MKTRLLLVRHGQSEANVLGIFTGHSNYALSKLGHEQAERTAQYIKAHYAVDGVYSSDLPRAYETAEHIARALNLPIITDARFREINGGDWENHNYDSLKALYPAEYTKWLTDVGSARCTNGESVLELANRVYEGLKAIAEANPGKCLVVATHATPVRVTAWKASGLPVSELQSVSWGNNCSVNEFEFSDGKLSAVKLNYVDHLAGMETSLPANV